MYKIIFKQSAIKELQQIPKPAIGKLVVAINKISENPRPVGIKN
jgi:mRNA-degrading endonuclease RelE of RelBE toxin-antitoxin system